MNKALTGIITIVALGVFWAAPAFAGDACGKDNCCCSPFGGYCKGSEWGWYGARKAVKSAAEAEKTIVTFFLPEKVRVANLQDKSSYYEAEVLQNNTVRDMVIIDKKTGRIRSIY